TVVLSSVFLLSSSGTLIVAEKGLANKNVKQIIMWLTVTLLFGLVFLGFEITEFSGFVADGYGVSTSSFLSAYYVLVGLHAALVFFGGGWMILLFIPLFVIKITESLYEEMFTIFSYYWHFVDAIWVFIMLIVYLPYLF